jgi:hypothetical protein
MRCIKRNSKYRLRLMFGRKIRGANGEGRVKSLQAERSKGAIMLSFAVAAVDWLNAYRINALETLIRLYDDNATQDCACDGQKMIAGKQALRAYWIDHFATHPAGDLAGLITKHDGAAVLYRSNNSIVQAQLIFNNQGKIAHVICGPADAQIKPLNNPAAN